MNVDQRAILSDAINLAYEARREAKACAEGEWNEPVRKLGEAVDKLAELIREIFEEMHDG